MTEIKEPIWVIGCNNSGTTILRDTILSHKNVCGSTIDGQELPGMPKIMTHYLGDMFSRLWTHPNTKLNYYVDESFYNEEIKCEIINAYKPYLKPGKTFISKSPTDVIRARFIQACFPDTKFIGIVRNGYAVSEGTIRKRKEDPDRHFLKGLFTSIDQAAEHWFRANVMILSNQTHLNNYLIIQYEDLVEKPKETLHQVLDFCSLEKEGFQIPTFQTNLNKIQISTLNEYELETVTRIAQPMLIHFGYEILGPDFKW